MSAPLRSPVPAAPAETAPKARKAPPSGVTRDPERTSAAILQAAMDEFAEKGLGGGRVDAIAARAGVNKRMIYHYFGDKDAIYARVLEEIYRRIRRAEQALELDHLSPEAAIRELARFTWRYFCDTPEFLSILATENLNEGRTVKSADWRRSINSPLTGLLSVVLARGAAEGRFKPGLDPVDVYVTMAGIGWFYLCNRHTLSASFNRDFLDAERLARWGDHMAEVTLAYVTAGAERAGGST